MRIEPWEIVAPAQLQYWPEHVHPSGPGAWGNLKSFQTLREAVKAAVSACGSTPVAFIMTSGGRMLKRADIEDLWLSLKSEPPSQDSAD